MNAIITTIGTPNGTKYALVVDGKQVETFDWKSAATLYALMEGYEVQE